MNEIVELLKKILASSAQHKEIMNTDEAAEFLGKSRSYIDSLKTRRHIPFYKSETGSCYFKRDELIA